MFLVIQFLYPQFLYGLSVLIVPIVLHFFSFKKYKKIYFSNFNFLASLQQQKKNSSKLKNLLLLLLRLIILATVVTAFANPYVAPHFRQNTAPEKNRVVIYLDNSFSMSNTGSKGSLLEEAKRQVIDIIRTYPAGVSFVLLTNDPQPPISRSGEETQSVVSSVRTSSATKKISQIFKETHEIAAGHRTTLFLLSDFQSHICDFQHLTTDSLVDPVFFLLEPENRSNLSIQEITFKEAFHKKGQNDKIAIRIVNSSPKDFNNVPVTLTLNGKKKGIGKINLPANTGQTVEISYLNTDDGFYKGVVDISDFPLVFDNKYYFTYKIDAKIRILCIEQNAHNPFFGKLFSDTASYETTYLGVNQTANTDFSGYHLIILDRLHSAWSGLESSLENYVIQGGNLFFLPGDDLSIQTGNRFFQKIHAPSFGQADTNTDIRYVEKQAALFRDAFEKQEDSRTLYPFAKRFYPLLLSQNSEKLLADDRGNTLLAAYPYGQGNIYISAFDFDPANSDMVFHPLFVPLLVNMAYNLNTNLHTSWTLHSGQAVIISNPGIPDNNSLKIVRIEDGFEFIPRVRKDFSGNLILQNSEDMQEAGFYEVQTEENTVAVIACNYDRQESLLHFCKPAELQQRFPGARIENIKTTRFDRNSALVREIVTEDNNIYLSHWFLLIAVLALLAEQWVWKKRLL